MNDVSVYEREFDPNKPVNTQDVDDSTANQVYVFDDPRLILAINVALKIERPLLVLGPPGSGKSSLAPSVARILGRRYQSAVMTARTEPDDLLWRFDALRRLNDAQAGGTLQPLDDYYVPGPFWRALDGNSSSRTADLTGAEKRLFGAVLLVDEIDKADPDLPNSLLVPLDEHGFTLPSGTRVEAAPNRTPLLIITSNGERELPAPFMRRCVVVTLAAPSLDHLLVVAQHHMGPANDDRLARDVAEELLNTTSGSLYAMAPPSTAEFLDTLRACHALGIRSGSKEWQYLTELALSKGRSRPGPAA